MATKTDAVGYMRTSSATNIGEGKDSGKRQRTAIQSYAKGAGYSVVDWFYDAAVRGTDPITERPGFAAMLERIASNGVQAIIVESPDRFARDLAVQLAGHDYLKGLGVALIPASSPDFFLEDTPTAVLVRQVLGAIAQFEKGTMVAKLKAARERKRAAGHKVEGRRSHSQLHPEVVMLAKKLRRRARSGRQRSLRDISAELARRGYVNVYGRPFAALSIRDMLKQRVQQPKEIR
jgi:DNA invertase Pin-like site-specific DNA recombinase